MKKKNYKLLFIGLILLINNSTLFSIPFATIKLNDSVYFDETEITVGAWLSYYSWTLDHEGYNAAQKILPDSNAIEPEVWKYITSKSSVIDDKITSTGLPIGFFCKKCDDAKKYGKRLRSISGSCDFIALPITGLTYEQVISFCDWRTKVTGDNKFIYRLPTIKEWKDFAISNLTLKDRQAGFRDSLYKGKCPVYNYKINCPCDKDSVLGKLLAVGLFSPGEKGVFDIFGNVSEMTSTKGISKGGNFKLFANQCHPDSIQYYSKPESWLGFRCIVVENKNNSKTLSKNRTSFNLTTKDSSSVIIMNGKFGSFIDNRDGTTYRVVRIGNQIWMAENLKFKPDSGKFWYPENNQENAYRYGYLYDWQTAKNVIPNGWHLPTKEEFETLVHNNEINELSAQIIVSGNSGFNALFGGLKIGYDYVASGLGTAFWSSTESGKRRVWGMGIGSQNSKILIVDSYKKTLGMPVRCIKND